MVQKYTAPVRVYKYPFELVMAAYERRFPTCHLIPVFVGSDVILETVNDDGSIHVIERRCMINVDAPFLLRKITGVDHVLFIQKNTLDRRKRTLKIEAWNESFSNRINIQELCYYKASKENPNWTLFEQQASLEVKSFWGFEPVVEKLAVKHYSQNVQKGEEIIEYHINELAQEGITYIAPFKESCIDGESSDVDLHEQQCNVTGGEKQQLQPQHHHHYHHHQQRNSSLTKCISLGEQTKHSTVANKPVDSFRSLSLEETNGHTTNSCATNNKRPGTKSDSRQTNGLSSSIEQNNGYKSSLQNSLTLS